MDDVKQKIFSRRALLTGSVPTALGAIALVQMANHAAAATPPAKAAAIKPLAPASAASKTATAKTATAKPGVAPAAAPAAAGALTHLDEKDPIAAALGYVADSSKVDPKIESMYKPGHKCSTCLNVQGKASDAWRPCTIFAKKLVNQNGWCRVWVQRPA